MRKPPQWYATLVSIPEHFYPFACKVEGKWVRGLKSYQHAVKHSMKVYGPGRLGYKLMLYRELLHFVGSILFIVSATLISKDLFGSEIALYVLLGAAILALSFQEFYLHPKLYKQRTRKGVIDWFTWVMPMITYLFYWS